MDDVLGIHRFQFAFTAAYHYLFPQITMGLAMLIFLLRSWEFRVKSGLHNQAANFWTKLFALHFAFGVVTGIPLEFQFGTNWSVFSEKTGGIIGQTLGMEGMYSFFLESAFLGLLIYGRDRLNAKLLWGVSGLLFLGTWLSGYFVIVTNAWMQHPVGYRIISEGVYVLDSAWALMTNPWAIWQYVHNMCGSVITAAFCVASTGAFYALNKTHHEMSAMFLKWGVTVGFMFCVLQVFPSGDMQGTLVAKHQPAALAAMEGHFHTEEGAGIALIGQPDMQRMELDNPIIVPKMLSFLTHKRWNAEIKGLSDFPKEEWPTNIPLLYYSYHLMVGLGTLFLALTGLSLLFLFKGQLATNRPLLWSLMLAFPFPFIANTAGWMTAELGRQPWLVYGLMRTVDGASPNVSAGNGMFSLLGFMGLYTVMTLLAVILTGKIVMQGPIESHHD